MDLDTRDLRMIRTALERYADNKLQAVGRLSALGWGSDLERRVLDRTMERSLRATALADKIAALLREDDPNAD